MADITQKLNRLEQLETKFQEQLAIEKLASLKELAYGAGHEINNPLANISVQAQTLLRDERDPERRRRLAAINSQAFRAHEMIADLMLFARPPETAPEATDLIPLVDEVIAQLADEAALQQTTIQRLGEVDKLVARVDPVQIAAALRALCANSLEALGHGGQVTLRVRAKESRATIEVADNGPGISDEARPHIFDPFFSGREAGRGLGFGLSKCWRIVELHNGRIDVASESGAGATFTIELPLEN
jgi:hypothetical protein